MVQNQTTWFQNTHKNKKPIFIKIVYKQCVQGCVETHCASQKQLLIFCYQLTGPVFTILLPTDQLIKLASPNN